MPDNIPPLPKVTNKKRISKQYDNLRKAEIYQNRLYEKYDSVQLIEFPRCTDAGNYVWLVGDVID